MKRASPLFSFKTVQKNREIFAMDLKL